MHDEDLMPIGQFAQAARVTVRTLRHYHTLGVLVPARVDPGTGYRYYLRAQLADLTSVRLLRELDIPLETIRAYRDGHRSLSSILEEERERLAAEAARAARGVAMIDQLAREAELPAPEAEVVELEPSDALTIAGPARADTLVADATLLISRMLADAEGLGLDTTTPVIGEYPASLEGTVTVRLYLPLVAPVPGEQGMVRPADLVSRPAGEEIGDLSAGGGTAGDPTGGAVGPGRTRGARSRSGPGGATASVEGSDHARDVPADVAAISRSTSPGGHYGRIVHAGPLESLPLAYHQLLGWLHRTGHPVRGPFLERYVDDPATTDPATLRTEVLHPVSVDR